MIQIQRLDLNAVTSGNICPHLRRETEDKRFHSQVCVCLKFH